jgi:hypothetical protein
LMTNLKIVLAIHLAIRARGLMIQLKLKSKNLAVPLRVL